MRDMLDRTAAIAPMAVDGWRYAAYPDAQSFADLLRDLRALFPPALLDGPGWARLLDHSRDLPAAAARAFGIDFPLDDPEPVVDFSCTAAPGMPVAAHYIRRGRQAAPGSPAARLGRCLADQAGGSPSLVRWTDWTGVTFDVAEPASGADPGPTVYLGLRRPGEADEENPQRTARGAAAAMVARIVGWSEDRREQRAVERAFDALPPRGWMHWAGAMPGRKRSIRLVAAGIGAPEVPAFLGRLGWPGSARAAESLLAEIRDLPAHLMQVLFDVTGDGPSTALGLEMSVGTPPALATTGAEDWRPLIDRLEETGRCAPVKGRALLAWLGRERIFTGSGACFVWKGLNHVKLTIKGEAVRTKAYPGIAVLGAGAGDRPPDRREDGEAKDGGGG